jgi:hypothetical protein
MPAWNNERVAFTHRVSITNGHSVFCINPESVSWDGAKRAGSQTESITPRSRTLQTCDCLW